LDTEKKRRTTFRSSIDEIFETLGITKLEKRINVSGKKNWGIEHNKGNKTVAEKLATTRTEDGQKQNTKTSTAI
jgi:hypothetical protein